MCTILANLSYDQTDLNPIEKHILLILCVHANKDTHQFFVSLARLMFESGYSKNTVEKSMKSLRDKNKILNTGKKAGKLKVTPIYKVLISSNPTIRGDLSLVTPSQKEVTPPRGVTGNPTTWDIERKDIKEKKVAKNIKEILKKLSTI